MLVDRSELCTNCIFKFSQLILKASARKQKEKEKQEKEEGKKREKEREKRSSCQQQSWPFWLKTGPECRHSTLARSAARTSRNGLLAFSTFAAAPADLEENLRELYSMRQRRRSCKRNVVKLLDIVLSCASCRRGSWRRRAKPNPQPRKNTSIL